MKITILTENGTLWKGYIVRMLYLIVTIGMLCGNVYIVNKYEFGEPEEYCGTIIEAERGLKSNTLRVSFVGYGDFIISNAPDKYVFQGIGTEFCTAINDIDKRDPHNIPPYAILFFVVSIVFVIISCVIFLVN